MAVDCFDGLRNQYSKSCVELTPTSIADYSLGPPSLLRLEYMAGIDSTAASCDDAGIIAHIDITVVSAVGGIWGRAGKSSRNGDVVLIVTAVLAPAVLAFVTSWP